VSQTPRDELKATVIAFVRNELLGSGEADVAQMQRMEPIIEERAEGLMRRFEQSVLTEEVKALIIKDVRAELSEVRRLDKLIDIGIGLASLLLGILTTVTTMTLGTNLEVLAVRGIKVTVFWFSVTSLLLAGTLLVLFTVRKFSSTLHVMPHSKVSLPSGRVKARGFL
jgi:hypothetical protein